MANRVLLGNRSTGGYGLYVSESGQNVLNCSKDKLLFYTDSGETGTSFVTKGMHQAVPFSGGTGSTAPVTKNTVNLSSATSASLTYQNLGNQNFLYTAKNYQQNANSSSFEQGANFSSVGATGATINRLGTGQSYDVVVFKKLSGNALY
tara:strand:+ start:14354 stop:14800 length:447 start_codon:yes stop_codon:yes gene_type:complete